jgi:hypothetical protein
MPDKSHVMFKFDPQISFGIVYKIITLDEKHLIIVYLMIMIRCLQDSYGFKILL